MALKFFWTCDSTTFDSDDYSAGDSTPSVLNTVSIDGSAARVGSAGILLESGTSGTYGFALGGLVTSALMDSTGSTRCTDLVCSVGLSMYINGSKTDTTGVIEGFVLQGNDTSNQFGLLTNSSGAGSLGLTLRGTGTGLATIVLTDSNVTVDAWHGIVARVDIPNDKMQLELYNASGSLVEMVDQTQIGSPDLAEYAPYLDSDASNGLRLGKATQAHVTYIDNVFVGNAFDDPIQNYFTISSYSQYGVSGIAPKAGFYRMLRNA